MNKNLVKRLLSFVMALVLSLTPFFSYGVINVKAEEETGEKVILPRPVYQFSFGDNMVDNTTVNNGEIATGKKTATLKEGAARVTGRDSKVLSLSGGSATAGYLTLPDDMYDTVTDGFTVSFWVQAETGNGSYSWVFQSSSQELGASNNGRPWPNDWQEPEFGIVVGGDDYDSVINLNQSNSSSKCNFTWSGKHIGNNVNWKHITVSVSKNDYVVFIDGERINITNKTNDMSTVLPEFFEEIEDYEYSALGQSLYTSDANAKAKFDDFRFYDAALTGEQIKAIYDSDDDSNRAEVTTIAVTGVTLDKKELALKVGGSETLTATVAPADAANKEVTWSTTDAGVAEVSGGKVTAKKAGTATITAASAETPNINAKCVITVNEDTQPVTLERINKITVKSASYNSIQVSWNKVDSADGYEVYRSTTVNGTYTLVKTITNGSAIKYKDAKLNFNKKYYYKVRAFKKVSGTTVNTEFTQMVAVKTKVGTPKVTLKKLSCVSIKVSWKKVCGASGYQVKYSLKKKSGYKLVTINKACKRSYKKDGLEKGKTYYVRVRAYRKVKSKKFYGDWTAVKTLKQ